MNKQKLRELVAKWRSEAIRADRTAKKPSIGRRLEGNAYRVCADELEAALAASAEAPDENFLRDCPDCEQEIATLPSPERLRALEEAEWLQREFLNKAHSLKDCFDIASARVSQLRALKSAPPASAARLREKAGK